ncbi:hypothetical protein BT69DRAFT_1343841 [Atractiella rhizophila]|nr:hypothetical protein BT69DRAFT_1343841 [Atractiella rhizophila]
MATASTFSLGLLTFSSLSFLLRSLDAERLCKRLFLRRVQAYLAVEEDCSPSSEKGDLDGGFGNGVEDEKKAEWWKIGAGSITRMNKADPLNVSLLPADRFRLLLLLNALIFLFSLAAFGSLLPIPNSQDQACRFLVAFAVLTFQLIHPITCLKLFLSLSTLSTKFYLRLLESPSTITKPFPRVGLYEQVAVYIVLLIRIGAAIATSALDGGILRREVCSIDISTAPGAVVLSIDFAMIAYLCIRYVWILRVAKSQGLRRMGDNGGDVIFDESYKQTCFGRWLVGQVIGRFTARVAALLVVVLSGASQWVSLSSVEAL